MTFGACLYPTHCFPPDSHSVNLAGTYLYGALPTGVSSAFPAASSTWTGTCVTGASTAVVGCSAADYAALVDLYTSTASSMTSWTVGGTTWLNPSVQPCLWSGVTCSGGRVTYVWHAACAVVPFLVTITADSPIAVTTCHGDVETNTLEGVQGHYSAPE